MISLYRGMLIVTIVSVPLMQDHFIVQGHVTIVSVPLMQDHFIVQGHVNCYYC